MRGKHAETDHKRVIRTDNWPRFEWHQHSRTCDALQLPEV